jgi:hypothetical protein
VSADTSLSKLAERGSSRDYWIHIKALTPARTKLNARLTGLDADDTTGMENNTYPSPLETTSWLSEQSKAPRRKKLSHAPPKPSLTLAVQVVL